MYKVVKIGDKDVPMMCMASCDDYYKIIFKEDPITLITTTKDNGVRKSTMYRIGFVMAKFAEHPKRSEMVKLTENDYLDWLDQFDNTDYRDAIEDITAVYAGNKATTSQEKKDTGR